MAGAIAEAFVRLRPDLRVFKIELQQGVDAAIRSVHPAPITIFANVKSRGGTVKADVANVEAALAGATAAEEKFSGALTGGSASARKHNVAVDALIAAERKLVAVDQAGALATTEVAEARAKATAASLALSRAERAESLARSTGNAAILEAATAARVEAEAKVEATTASFALAGAEKQEAVVRNALAAATTRLAEVEQAGALATTETAAARAQVLTATSALAKAVRAETLARETSNASLIEETAALRAEAAAKLAATEASLGLATAEKADAAAASQAATAHASTARGAGASLLTLLGLRGATLAANASFLAGAAAIAVLVKSVKSFADLETELNTFQVVAGATADEMERIGAEARALGRDVTLPGVSAGDAARALTELAKAGLSIEDALSGARGVLQLSAAANIDVAEAAAIAGAALNAFGLSGDQATHVADLLTGASIAAQGEVTDMAQSLTQAATVASQFGLTVDETAGAITLLAKNGLLGSDAGTSLRTTLLRLVPTSKEAADTVNRLGIAFQDVSGRTLPLPEIFQNYREALGRLTPVQRQFALTTIFGSDAIRAATIFTNAGAQGLRDMTEAANRAGAAQEVSAARTKGFAGQLEALKSNADTAGATLGTVLAPALESLIGDANDAVSAFNEFTDVLRSIGGVNVNIGGFNVQLSETLGLLKRFTISPLEAPFLSVKAVKLGVDQLGSTNDDLRREIDDLKRQADDLDAVGRQPAPNLDKFFQSFGSQPQFQSGMADAGERAGIEFISGIGRGIESAEDRAIRKAREALKRIVKEGKLAITQSVEDAKANLLSLGSSLSQQVGELIDFGPLGQRIKGLEDSLAASQTQNQRRGLTNDLHEANIALKEGLIDAGPLGQKLKTLQDQLARSQTQGTRRGLVNDLREAREEMAKAQRAVATGGGPVSDVQQASINEFLRPFRENLAAANQALKENDLQGQIGKVTDQITKQKEALQGDPLQRLRQGVTDAQQAIKTFNTEQLIGQLRKQAEAEKQAVSRGIADVITQFNKGGISMAQANTRIANLIGRTVGPWQTAGKRLGEAFNTKFLSTVEGIQEQLEQIVLGPQRPGTTGVRSSVRNPRDTVAAELQRRQDARDRIQEAVQKKTDAIATATAATATNTATIAINTAPPSGKRVSGR